MTTRFKLNKHYLTHIRNYLFGGWIISLLMFFIGIFFIDSRWWWLLLFIAPMSTALLLLFKREILGTHIQRILKSIIEWMMLATFLFVAICAIFITPLWWFGLLIVVWLGIMWMIVNKGKSKIKIYNKNTVPITVSIAFVFTFALYCVPSFVANHIETPNNSYSDVPKVYVLYGGDINDPTINREHIYAQSWFNANNRVRDNHNVVWSNSVINSQRGNKEFGYGPDKFEPANEYKGDVARAMLYMYVTYGYHQDFDKSKVNVNLMKDWATLDPVSLDERLLNHLIKTTSIQKNGNPYIDNPSLIGFIV